MTGISQTSPCLGENDEVTGTESVVLIGSRSNISVIGFRILREAGVSVPLVITGDEDPGVDDWRLSLAKAARDAGYEEGNNLVTVNNPHTGEILSRIRAVSADLVLSLQWRRIIRGPLIQLAKRGVVNLHNSPLPLLRGCDPFSWAIHDGLEMMGVTLHQVVDEGVDSGPILTQRVWPITAAATAWSLYLDAIRESELLLRETLLALISGDLVQEVQDARYAGYHPMAQFRFEDLEVNWNLPAVTVSAALRSRIFPPFQLPFFIVATQVVEIVRCHAVSLHGEPSIVASIDPFAIGAKRGAIQIDRVRIDGVEEHGTDFATRAGLKVRDDIRAKRLATKASAA